MLPPHACETLRRGVVVTAGAGRGEGGDDHLDRSAATQRFAFAGLLTRYGLKRVRRALAAPFLWLVIRPAGPPIRLVIAPQDIRTADPVVASEIYSGLFVLGGKVVDAHGRSPFDLPPPSRAWAEALHGFGWLRHMRAADTSLARANAQALVGDWMVHARRGAPPLAAAPVVMARRLLSLLSQSPVVLDGADGRFYGRLMRSMAREGIALQRRLGAGLDGDARFWAALAVAEVGLCAENGAPYRRGGRLFLEELGRQVLADGGPASRDPSTLVDLLLDLLPLRQAYAARGSAVPPALLNAIDRMIPMLRMLRHGDGTLALFNGMGVTEADAIATILAYDDSRAMPLANAPYSGYQRLEAGPGILICDTGVAPTPEFATRAHAAPLAFEFSTGAQRIIVNCGRPASPGPAALAARSTAAHSTLVLADRSAGCFFEAPAFASALDGALLQGAATVPRVAGGRMTGRTGSRRPTTATPATSASAIAGVSPCPATGCGWRARTASTRWATRRRRLCPARCGSICIPRSDPCRWRMAG